MSFGRRGADDRAEADSPIEHLGHCRRVSLGQVELEVRATPGHTPESICVVVYEHAGDPVPFGVLTGDTLFIGDVGRPDLLSSDGVTAEDLARRLYRSLHEELLTLPDDTRVFPAHPAPACFSYSAHRNRERHALLGEHDPPPALSLDQTLDVVARGGAVLDTRSVTDFAAAHVRGSVNVGLETRFAECPSPS